MESGIFEHLDIVRHSKSLKCFACVANYVEFCASCAYLFRNGLSDAGD